MKKQNENLFKIGEISKTLGVTRKAILLYEEMGLITPAFKDNESGYRYYTADNMTQIRSIRSLQKLGLSLNEIKEYYSDTSNIEHHLLRLMEFRKTLDQNIQMLQLRSIKAGDSTIHRIYLSHQVCYCHKYQCLDTVKAADLLRDTYIAAVKTGYMLMDSKIFTVRITDSNEKYSSNIIHTTDISEKDSSDIIHTTDTGEKDSSDIIHTTDTSEKVSSDITDADNIYANVPFTSKLEIVNNDTSDSILNLMGCIPVRADYNGPGRVEFAETQALCIYHRGPYDKITEVIQILTKYIKEHHIKKMGDFRSTYLQGPPNCGANSADYITQVAVPVEFPIEF